MVLNNSHTTRYKGIITFAGLLLQLTGIVVLFGWIFNIEILKRISAEYPSMKVNTALGMVFLSIAYLSLIYGTGKKYKSIAYTAIIPVLIIGCMSVTENVFYTNLGIDELLLKDIKVSQNTPDLPGRMSAVASVCFVLASVWVLLAKSGKDKLVTIAQYCLHGITLLSGGVLFGYMYGEEYLRNFGVGAQMALHSSLCFLLFSITASLLNPEVGITAVFTGDKTGNVMARKMLTRMLLAITVIGYGEIFIHNHHIALPGLSSTVLTVVLIISAILFIKDVSGKLNNLEEKKDFAYQNLSLGIEAAPYALIITDNTGKIQHINQEAEKLYGYNRKELIGQPVAKLQPNGNDIFNTEQRASFFEKGKIIRLGDESSEYVKQKDGNLFPAELTFTPFRSMYGPSILISVIDLTDVKHKEQIISQQLHELHNKNNELEQFNYIASHDLQEPLRTVSNYIMLLSEDYPEIIGGSEIKEHLDVMSSATGRMSTLIRSLLDFGRLGRNRKLSTINCESVVNEVRTDLKNLINNASASIIIDTPLPELYGYEMELRQLFQNLINNAIKFRKDDMHPLINIGCNKTDNSYEFYISDNGIGIEPRHFGNIFNIFQRIHPADVYEGYGVGLANCKKIAEMHGGKIWVESIPGEGSTFWFKILHLKKYDEMLVAV
jgi:PAS domain S-box-containing protein